MAFVRCVCVSVCVWVGVCEVWSKCVRIHVCIPMLMCEIERETQRYREREIEGQ